MNHQLIKLESQRLHFRPFTLKDAPSVHHFLQEKEIADNTLSIPYPYLEGMAQEWIKAHPAHLALGEYKFAVILKENNALIGAIEIAVTEEFFHGGLGYWIGKPFWGRGYGTEAVARIIQYGFEDLGLHRIFANHFTFNKTSSRIMVKNRMQQEGTLREHIYKNGTFHDIEMKAILKSEWAL